ncbi:MAG: dTDP-4-dehydrorhamnose reductase [Candidatus Nomurabacteria bacterium GW2011_GWE1_35_16]|uniref:dTDP-4-dehydrorhamnose reductase n=1 Tax=Candidatus Nomurabacteria bacterium GW2011_GWE1_35_16 TaxID=1618761 RepID=A0A0G0BPG9_9BACT|nr:MAG: dTDP-4-dehydrorhamnose reductase [Candidatus Nomurabacteria bacterium GW2011_GWE1_35_16]
MEKHLVLGYGRLGKEIVEQTQWDYISRKKNNFDFCNMATYEKYLYDYDVLINCIAHTGTYAQDYQTILDVNFKSVCNLVDFCNLHNKKIIQISSDYIYGGSVPNASEEDVPVHARTWYAYSKLVSDAYVQVFAKNYLLIRTSFKAKPFPYERAPVKQMGNFDYTDVIASLIIQLIKNNAQGIFNVGTELKNIYQLAVQTKPDAIRFEGVIDPNMPLDVSMNLEKMNDFIEHSTSSL